MKVRTFLAKILVHSQCTVAIAKDGGAMVPIIGRPREPNEPLAAISVHLPLSLRRQPR